MTHRFEHIEPTWNDDFKNFNYHYLPHRDLGMVDTWVKQGYGLFNLNGAIHDLKDNLPEFVKNFTDKQGWTNVGCAYYQMNTGDYLPEHRDHYIAYSKRFDVSSDRVWRAIIFLEDWKVGHYFDIAQKGVTNWRRGDVVIWNYDVPHSAGNFGQDPRYTLQVTGTL